jgi:hypothetical protein
MFFWSSIRSGETRKVTMIDTKTAPYAALVLRLSTGILFLLHGLYLKVFVFTMAGTAILRHARPTHLVRLGGHAL